MTRTGIIIFGIGIALLGAGYLFFSEDDSPPTNYPPPEGSVVAFGDSLVAGSGVRDETTFVEHIEKELDIPIRNAGAAGDTTEDARKRLERDVLTHDPAIVIILLGGNDAIENVPPDETFAHLEEMIAHIHESGAVVVLCGVQGGILQDAYAGRFADLADATGVAFVPNVLEGLIGDPQYMADTIHPNTEGHKRIAERVLPVLRPLVEARGGE